MPKDFMNEREFELINIVGAQVVQNQRDLSRQMNVSLGMINMLVKRLVTKGFIRIQQLNQRKVQYLLTPKGFVEKMRKSVKYTVKTINSISIIKNRLKSILKEVYDKGERNFYILGKSDLAFLIDVVLKEENLMNCQIEHGNDYPKNFDGIVLVCKEEDEILGEVFDGRSINLINELAKNQILFNKT